MCYSVSGRSIQAAGCSRAGKIVKYLSFCDKVTEAAGVQWYTQNVITIKE